MARLHTFADKNLERGIIRGAFGEKARHLKKSSCAYISPYIFLSKIRV